MKKITIIALHLGFGGIENAIASFSNMACNDYEINIISTYKLYEKSAFKINSKIKIDYLMNYKPNKKEFIYAFKHLKLKEMIREVSKSIKILKLKKSLMIDAIKKCDSDIIISTRPFHNNLLGKYGKKSALKIAWEHSHHNGNRKYIKKVVNSCKNMDYLILVSKELTKFYSNIIHNDKTKCKYISLPLDNFPNKLSSLDKKEIISIGRLSKEKGFVDLIDVFKLVNDVHPDWHINIIGDGLEKDKIVKRIKKYNLSKFVILHGFKDKKDLNKILLNSSICVMTSLTESFGLVLIEAMSYGIPCISFDSARGSLEIIDNKKNGFIIKDRNKKEMADQIINLIENPTKRLEMGLSGHNKSLTFSEKTVMGEWKKILK